MIRRICFLNVLVFLYTQLNNSAADCIKGNLHQRLYSDSIVNYTIVGPVLASFKATNAKECTTACHMTDGDNCYMYNYSPSSKLCELLYNDRSAESYRIEKRMGYHFKTRKCKTNPCVNGGQCYTLGNRSSAACLCKAPFYGAICQDQPTSENSPTSETNNAVSGSDAGSNAESSTESSAGGNAGSDAGSNAGSNAGSDSNINPKSSSRIVNYAFSGSIVNQTIVGPVLYTSYRINETYCEAACNSSQLCSMFNYRPSSKLCQKLYHGRAGEYRIQKEVGCSFKTRKCLFGRCIPEGGQCIALSSRYNQKCICNPEYNGSYCHIHQRGIYLTAPVCIHAKGDKPGVFQVPASGAIKTVRLVHSNGSLTGWDGKEAPGFWGSDDIELYITTQSRNTTITPPAGYPTKGERMSYSIPGFSSSSPELVFPEMDPPLVVTRGQYFSIWYNQDRIDLAESDNDGVSCSHVYVYYTK